MPSWDLVDLEQNTGDANLSSVVGSSGSRTAGLDCSVDLKLGILGEFGMADKWKEQRKAFAMPIEMSPRVVQFKRPRVLSGCLVDGCRNDLSRCREYHRRHKVCEMHSKTPIVLVAGKEQRFCQQCSRFHLLVEFDEVKRSCRKRLDGHNRRRRKPQLDSISGTRFPNYPQTFSTAATDSTLTAIIKSEEDPLNCHQPSPLRFNNRVAILPSPHHFGSSFCWSLKQGKQHPLLHNDEMALISRTPLEPADAKQPLHKTISSAAESSSKKTNFTNGLPRESDCALSLLSSSTHKHSINPSNDMPVERFPTGGQPMLSSLHYGIELGLYSHLQGTTNNVFTTTGFLCSGVENEHVGTVLVSDAIEADLRRLEGEGTSNMVFQSLPFSWY